MENEEKIPFIYNWCDRWCEKCSFVRRCYLGSMDLENGDTSDNDGETLAEKLKSSLQAASELLDEAAKTLGISLNDMTAEERADIEAEMDLADLMVESHPLADKTDQYAQSVEAWLQKDGVKSDIQEYEEALEMIGHDRIGMGEALTMQECFHVIRWYLLFIPTKCRRMLFELQDDWGDDPQSVRSHNGTAKISLIAVERSIAAWYSMSELLPTYREDILAFMIQLKQIQKMIETICPHAEEFIRPGFDEYG